MGVDYVNKESSMSNMPARRMRLSVRMMTVVICFILVALSIPTYGVLSSNSSFVITSPNTNTTIGNKSISFTWTAVANASRYRLQLTSTDDPQFEGPDYTVRSKQTTVVKSVYAMSYIARVTAFDSSGKRLGVTPTITFTASRNVASNTPVTTKPATTTSTILTQPSTTSTVPVTTQPVSSPDGLWTPKPGTTWYWQINGKVNENIDVAMYDIDLFDAVPTARSYSVAGFGIVNVSKGQNAGVIDRLHAKGRTVICYVDTGAAEYNRPDYKYIPASVQGSVAQASDGSQWDEKWLDTSSPASWLKFAPLMWARFDLAKQIGCDGVEPDQNNHVGNETGFPESAAIDRAWYLEVAKQAHARGLSVGMKNGIEAVNAQTVAAFDWALNEECHQYSECSVMKPFLDAGKAVFNAEYPFMPGGPNQTKACDKKPAGISTMGFPIELGGGYFFDCLTGLSVATGTKK